MATNTTRVNCTLPSEVVELLDELAARVGVTRSGLISVLLSQSAPGLRQLLAILPESPDGTPEQVRRYRGDSRKLFTDLMNGALPDDI